eukprot:1464089-Amphidinium_carterae.1
MLGGEWSPFERLPLRADSRDGQPRDGSTWMKLDANGVLPRVMRELVQLIVYKSAEDEPVMVKELFIVQENGRQRRSVASTNFVGSLAVILCVARCPEVR